MQQAGTPKGGVGGRLGSSDAHHDGRISQAYLRWLYPHENTLISPGIKYQYSEIALINMERVYSCGQSKSTNSNKCINQFIETSGDFLKSENHRNRQGLSKDWEDLSIGTSRFPKSDDLTENRAEKIGASQKILKMSFLDRSWWALSSSTKKIKKINLHPGEKNSKMWQPGGLTHHRIR